MQVRSETHVTQQVNRYAEQTATLVGSRLGTSKASSAPCEGQAGELSEEVFYVQGAYQLPVPADQQLATLARLRDQWRAQGYTITEDRTFGPTEGSLAAKTPTDGYTISLESTTPPTAPALLVHSACYQKPG